jgi:hypothetical protein
MIDLFEYVKLKLFSNNNCLIAIEMIVLLFFVGTLSWIK